MNPLWQDQDNQTLQLVAQSAKDSIGGPDFLREGSTPDCSNTVITHCTPLPLLDTPSSPQSQNEQGAQILSLQRTDRAEDSVSPVLCPLSSVRTLGKDSRDYEPAGASSFSHFRGLPAVRRCEGQPESSRGWGRGYAMEEFRSAMVPPGSEQHLSLSRCHLGLWPQTGLHVAAHLPPPHPNIHSQHPETTYLLCSLTLLRLRLSSQSWCAPTDTPRYPRTGGLGKGTVASVLSAPPLSTHSGFEGVAQAH